MLLGLAPLLGPAGAAVVQADGTCTTASGHVTCTFAYTGKPQTWTVPGGVTSAAFDVGGARGGGVAGGYGGAASANFGVTPGQTYQIMVGGSGDAGNGFNGGGRGGGSTGGGASDIRSGACASTSSCGLDARIIVGGGGGGGGGTSGGWGGGTSGQNSPSNSGLVDGGGGGTSTAGGFAGGTTTQYCPTPVIPPAGGLVYLTSGTSTCTVSTTPPPPPPLSATPGTAGSRGTGGASGQNSRGGGGGGGGWFGGGGGDEVGGGGGGSGYGPAGVVFRTAAPSDRTAQAGNGVVRVSYAAPASAAISPSAASMTAPLFRLYSPLHGEHLYTTSPAEHDQAVSSLGYVDEGTAAYVSDTAQSELVPLYRVSLISGSSWDRLYTTSLAEHDQAVSSLGYLDEGVVAYVSATAQSGLVPLYRLYNADAGKHLFTASTAERDQAVSSLGYASEGVAAYVVPSTP